MHCVKNECNPKLWYYGDLFVENEYRRNGKLAIQTTNDNIPAQSLYKKCGYSEVRETDKIVFVKALQ